MEQQPSFDFNELQRAVTYPEAARRNAIEGRVFVSLLLSKTGSVLKVKIVESASPHLNDAAVQAVMKTRFTPAYVNSKPSLCWVRIPILFQLR
ncbi:MAG: energy transducer TonB [Bacteroidetes bacterium]|nr:energy transducer TonB [Bacteroidota bacterium]